MAAETKNREQSRTNVRPNSPARLAGLVCGMVLALNAVAFAQQRGEARQDGQANATGFAGKVYTGKFQTAYGVRELSYQVLRAAESGLEEDLAIFEGDIILGTVNKGTVSYSAGRSNLAFRWVDGVVPFEIDGAYSAAEKQIINAAINYWNGNTPYWLRQRNGESDFVRFVRNTTGNCNSAVGRQGLQQAINIDAPQCGTGSTIHEIGHAVGLWHEQSRADRNNFVLINFANIQPGKAFNFQTYIQQGQDGQDMFDYDFNSIMHYSSFAFSSNGMPTITRLDGSLITPQTTALTEGDIAGAVRMLTKNGPATFKLVNADSGKCLTVPNARAANWVNPLDCHGGATQRWYIWTVPGTKSAVVINDWSGKCLEIQDGSLADGAYVRQTPCHGFISQRFRSFPYLLNENSLKCAEPSGPNGTRVQQFTCNFGPSQKWQMVW